MRPKRLDGNELFQHLHSYSTEDCMKSGTEVLIQSSTSWKEEEDQLFRRGLCFNT
jgi:hypothetical protein